MREISLVAGGVLVILVGIGCAFGSIVLSRGKAVDWPDVIAAPPILRRVAIGLALAAATLLASGGAVLAQLPWSIHGATASLALFVAGGYWGNHAVFGDFRPTHTGSNVAIAVVALLLLWAGYPALLPVE